MTQQEFDTVGTIGNYYGALSVKEEDGKCFWAIENYTGFRWEEIPKTLYDALLDFERKRKEA